VAVPDFDKFPWTGEAADFDKFASPAQARERVVRADSDKFIRAGSVGCWRLVTDAGRRAFLAPRPKADSKNKEIGISSEALCHKPPERV